MEPKPTRTGAFRHDQALEPDPFLSRMLAEAPVCPVRMPYGKATAGWSPAAPMCGPCPRTGALAGPRWSTETSRGSSPPDHAARAINLMDPPALNRLRHLVAAAFTTQQVERLRPWTGGWPKKLLNAMTQHGPPADVTGQLAARLPLMTICQLLAIPEQDRQWLRRQAVAMMSMSPAERDSAAEAKAGSHHCLGSHLARMMLQQPSAPCSPASPGDTWPYPTTAAMGQYRSGATPSPCRWHDKPARIPAGRMASSLPRPGARRAIPRWRAQAGTPTPGNANELAFDSQKKRQKNTNPL